jgi:outer membrane receptor protein involved in Fe transport
VIRGQSNVLAGVQFGVESGAAYFIDGVYFPGDIQGIDLNALERVEVIRGPQSALYGRNTYSGAINFITRQPTEDLEARVRAVAAQYGEQDYSFSVGSSFFDDKFGAKLFARSYSYDGEYKNTLTGRKVGDESTKSVGLSLNWNPIEDLEILASGFFREDDDGPLALFLQPASMNNCKPGYRSAAYRSVAPGSNPNQYFCGVIKPGTVALNTDPLPVLVGSATQVRDGTAFDGVETDEYFGTLRADWNIGGSGWVLTSLSGYRDYENLFGTDSDHSNAFTLIPTFIPGQGLVYPPASEEPLFANTNRNDTRSVSTELRIASPQDRRLRGLIGGYYFDLEDDGSDLTFAHPRGGGTADYTETLTNEAVFGLLAFDITDKLTLTGELRYMEETKERTEYCSTVNYNWITQRCSNAAGTANALALGQVRYQDDAKFDSTTPRITIDYQINDDWMVYGIFAQGAKPGGLNGVAGQSINVPTYDQEESDNFEIGTKVNLFDSRVRIGLAAYFTQATDVQFTQSVPTSTGQGAVTSIATNQGEGEIMGLELDLQAAITEALTLSATYSFTDTEITKGCDDFQYTLNTGGIVYDPALGTVKECSISGNRYPLAPEETASLALNYDAPLAGGNGLNLIGNFSTTYEGSKYIQVHNLAETGNTTLVNLRVGVRSDNGWSIVAFGRNLTDNDTIPMATRWFDLRTGSARICNGTTITSSCIPATPTPGRAGGGDTGSPRAFFGALRKGRTFGLEFTYDFKL